MSVNIFAQSDWHFETKIERNNHYLLEGSIADKYPITMFLEPCKHCDMETRNRWNYAYESMQWQTNGNKSFLPVKLKEVSRPSMETKSTVSLYVRGVEMFSFDLTDKLKDLKDVYGTSIGGAYIETIKLEVSKKIDNDFYLIFSFSQPTVPNSNGFGHCGAGYESYLGFLHISSFELKDFKYYQTYSCLKEISEEYMFDENAPEKGITVR